MPDISTIILIVIVILGLLLFGIILSFFNVWLRAWLAGAYVGFTELIAMRLRQVPFGMVVDARITAKKAGIDIPINDIEAHFLAGGNVIPSIQALIAAHKAGIALDWNRTCAIDLATKGSGKSVNEAVRTSVDPKVIDCPNPASGRLTIDGQKAMIAVMDFKFFAGSMGSVVGEKITRAIEMAIAEKRGVIIVSASSGARMQEGMLSLMQMAKTCGALARLSEAKLPYISLLTHPTTGGVTASFATIGDINLAEPKCMIGFAGPRVVKETTHQNLPPGFQTAEFMLEHGLIDAIVHRSKLRERLCSLLAYMMPE